MTMYSLYTTSASCGGIQLISIVGYFHANPFETVVYNGMIHRKFHIQTEADLDKK
jgi:hypothetical protein